MQHAIICEVDCYDSQRLKKDLFLLAAQYSAIQVSTIGHSVNGSAIYAIHISVTQGKIPSAHVKKIHWNGSFHANEWITTPLLMKFVEDMAEALQSEASLRGRNIRELLTDTEIWIVPMVNPDGVDLVVRGLEGICDCHYRAEEEFTHNIEMDKGEVQGEDADDIINGDRFTSHRLCQQLLAWNQGSSDFSGWKANLRGVDLNDQFPANWQEEVNRRQVFAPAPRDYPGHRPLCEPEAQALALFTLYHEFDVVICLHTQGKEVYWNYRSLESENALAMATAMAHSCGYQAVSISDSDAGFKDWFIQDFRKLGFTVEVGNGVNPLSIKCFTQCYEEVSELLLTSLEMQQSFTKKS